MTLVTLWTVAHRASLSMGFPRQEYWSALPFSPLGDLPNPGIKPTSPVSPTLQADSLPRSHWGKPYWIFAPSPKSICWNPNPKGMVSGSGHFGRWLGYEGEALINGISVLTNETPETLLSFHHMRTQQENIVYNQKGDSHQTLDLPAPCSWIFLSPDLWEIKICCHRHPVYGNFVIAAKFDQDQSCDGVVVVFL